MKKIIFKKITAFLLVMCMTLSLLPVKLFAEEEMAESEVTQSEDLADEVISPIIVSEDVTKRGENEKHFLCDDGSYIAVSYPTAVHEQVDGEWVDIEYDVKADGDGISPADDSIKVKFANNTNSAKLVKLESGDYKISWTVEAESLDGDITEKVKLSKDSKTVLKTAKELAKENSDKIKKSAKYTAEEVAGAKQKAKAELKKLDLQKSENIEESQEVLAVNGIIEDYNRQQIQSVTTAQSSIEYEGAFGEGTVLRYILSPGKINEEIVLDSYNGFKSYSMVIDTDGLTPAAKENGRVDLTDEDENTVVTIAPPFMYDSLDNVSHDVEVTVAQENKKQWRITYTPDQNWLKDENRAYPVVIDPIVTTRLQYQADTYVYQGQGLYDYHYAETFLWVGYQVLENNQKKEFISYWGYNMDLPANGVVTANNITDVSFYIRAKEDTERLGRISLYDTDEFYGNINTVTWNNRPEVGSRNYGHVTSMMSDNWLCFSNDNLYETIKGYYDNASIHEILFALKTTATSSLSSPTALYSSNSSYIPYIAIEYVGGETTEPDTGVDGGSGTEPGLIYPAGYTTEIETGVYIIKNQYNSRYLHHSDGNNTVNVWNFGNQPYQRWYVEKNGLDGTYTFSSSSTENPGLNMEVYFGENENDQPITMYNYSGQAESRAYRFFIIKNTNGTYSIMPTVSTDKVLEVYAGQNYSDTFGEYDRLFYKNHGESVQLKSFTGTANQCWTFKNTTQYDREWDNTLAEGTYIIKNSQTGNALSHIISANTAEATPYTGESYQKWKLIKTDATGIYTLSPDSQPLFNLELYYASLNGACNDGHTFTLNNYSNNTSSPYIKVRVKKHTVGQEVKYSIFPLVTPDKCIEVYLGEDTTYTFNTRTFTKSNGRFLQNTTYIASEVQKWEFVPLMGITPESCELHIGDTYDLDNVTPINTQNDLIWNLTFGEDFVNFDSTTNEVLAKRPGIAVFETRLPNGIDYQFIVTVLESRPIADGVYYIKNNYSNKYVSPAGNSISNGTYLKQEEKIEGDYAQMWEITYANNGGYTIKPAYDTLLGVTATNNSSGNNYSVSMVNTSNAKWAIVEYSPGSYNIIPFDFPEKALSIEPVTPANGIDVVAQNRLNGANQQEWIFENVDAQYAASAKTIYADEQVIGEFLTLGDVVWYKIVIPTYSRQLTLTYEDIGEDNVELLIDVYTGNLPVPNNLQGVLYTHYLSETLSITYDNHIAGNVFYIKVSTVPMKDYTSTELEEYTKNYSVNCSFRITCSFSITTNNVGNEIQGWRLLDNKNKKIPTIYYYVDQSMKDEYIKLESKTYSFESLFLDAIELWNNANPNTEIGNLFEVSTNLNNPKISVNNEMTDFVLGTNEYLTGDINLNPKGFTKMNKAQAVKAICHELGHTLGLADLYVTDKYEYYYNGELINNKYHLMYGKEPKINNDIGYFHEDDIEGVRNSYNWFSLVEISESEVYSKADYIVSGTIVSLNSFNEKYTRVLIKVDEYIYGSSNSKYISFLQMGTNESEYYVDPIFNIGDNYILFLHYDLYDELFVVGGPQGRFLLEETEGEIEVTNQIDRIVEITMEEKYGISKKFSKKMERFKIDSNNEIKRLPFSKK